jgi:protein-arginine kinase
MLINQSKVHPMDLDPSKLVFNDEQKLIFNKYVASTRIRAARNVSGFSLPAGTSVEDRAGVEEVVKQAFAGLTGELSGKTT